MQPLYGYVVGQVAFYDFGHVIKLYIAVVDAFGVDHHRGAQPAGIEAAGCLDTCGLGPSVVVYPEGIHYGNVQLDDVPEIVESHLANNVPVERLQLNF